MCLGWGCRLRLEGGGEPPPALQVGPTPPRPILANKSNKSDFMKRAKKEGFYGNCFILQVTKSLILIIKQDWEKISRVVFKHSANLIGSAFPDKNLAENPKKLAVSGH